VIKYLGSKRLLVPAIVEVIQGLGHQVASVLDLFSGTSRVGHALKAAGYQVFSNDLNAYAHTLATCYVQADRDELLDDASRLLVELNALPGRPGYFTETFCEQARFFQPRNGARIDAIRDEIARKCLPPELEAVLLVSLMEAADRVDSTTGLQMAYLKRWAPRSFKDLELRLPALLPRAPRGKGRAFLGDAVATAAAVEVDLVYMDPPYNQHSYLANYHIWESLVLWDRPEVYGVARKRVDVRQRRSGFNAKATFTGAMTAALAAVRARHLLVSFSNEGYLTRDEMEGLLRARGQVTTFEHEFKRYVGAKIGIHNASGARVGAVSHLHNKEFLFLVSP
jgi:adenine-specific DNA-methyltransferase